MSQLPYPLHFAAACYYSLCENYSRSMREKKKPGKYRTRKCEILEIHAKKTLVVSRFR